MEARVCFCRFTQFSLLRLLTTQAVMGADEVMTQTQAWQAFDRWLTDSRVVLLDEPPNLDGPFRSLFQPKFAKSEDLGQTPTSRPSPLFPACVW